MGVKTNYDTLKIALSIFPLNIGRTDQTEMLQKRAQKRWKPQLAHPEQPDITSASWRINLLKESEGRVRYVVAQVLDAFSCYWRSQRLTTRGSRNFEVGPTERFAHGVESSKEFCRSRTHRDPEVDPPQQLRTVQEIVDQLEQEYYILLLSSNLERVKLKERCNLAQGNIPYTSRPI